MARIWCTNPGVFFLELCPQGPFAYCQPRKEFQLPALQNHEFPTQPSPTPLDFTSSLGFSVNIQDSTFHSSLTCSDS